ncbi:myosin heavy chain, muscle-like [Penaeus vannamei]|uniref:myosin heavy chain, muscle-like n=1 Tax=Penaeus vannamei TaxID=6689 RepID=UPI00387F617F
MYSVRRENQGLAEEIKDLMEQISEGGRSLHEIEKSAKRFEIEKEELQAALEEAETALEQEENKVLRGQLELSQVKQEIDKRIQEKEEEFDATRRTGLLLPKISAKVVQASPVAEAYTDELEIALDHANKANGDIQKQVKKAQAEMKDMQARVEEEQRLASEYREQCSVRPMLSMVNWRNPALFWSSLIADAVRLNPNCLMPTRPLATLQPSMDPCPWQRESLRSRFRPWLKSSSTRCFTGWCRSSFDAGNEW